MPENNHSSAPLPPPHVQLIQMAMAHWVSRIAYVAAKLGLADHLANGPKTADDLAGPTGTHAPSLYRLMRALTNLNILTEDATHRFALTPLGEALKTGAPGSARPSILTLASDWMSRGWEQLLYSVQTGGCGFEQSLGMPIFDWLAKHPEDASLFSETMMGFHGAEPAAISRRLRFFRLIDRDRRGRGHGTSPDDDSHRQSRITRHPLRPASCGSQRTGADSGSRPG
jgi:hypothetical protein